MGGLDQVVFLRASCSSLCPGDGALGATVAETKKLKKRLWGMTKATNHPRQFWKEPSRARAALPFSAVTSGRVGCVLQQALSSDWTEYLYLRPEHVSLRFGGGRSSASYPREKKHQGSGVAAEWMVGKDKAGRGGLLARRGCPPLAACRYLAPLGRRRGGGVGGRRTDRRRSTAPSPPRPSSRR
jgi:hypothetical protein